VTTAVDNGRVDATRGDAAGLMVLRLWIEPGDRLRVRITQSNQLESASAITSYAATPGDVLEQVQAWLHSFVTPR